MTVGGSQWITGPASKKCYEYDPKAKQWVHALDLKVRSTSGAVGFATESC